MEASEKIKILVADDDAFIRDVLAAILEGGGYAVATAENGTEAFAQYTADPGIGLVISDMNMPGLSGMEVIAKLRGMGSDVPVIILTGNSEVSTAIQALNSGASDYLLKDENIQDTVSFSVSRVLEKHSLKKQNAQLMADLALKNDRLEKDRALAQKVQKNILPRQLNFAGFETGTLYRPSDQIGGDFFDAWETDGYVHFIIGDVSGHSTSSALVMAVAKGMLQSLGMSGHRPVSIVQTANRMLSETLSDSGMFLSLVYGVFDRKDNTVRIVSAGHNPVYHVNAGGVHAIESTGPVLGWDPEDAWEESVVSIGDNDLLFLYTDGLTEAKDAGGVDFGEERLQALLAQSGPPVALVEKISRTVSEHCAGQFSDDLTMLVLKKGGAHA